MKNVLKKYSDVIKWFVDNPIPKDSYNKHLEYHYAGSEIVMHNVNSKLHEVGLILQFVGFEINIEKTQIVNSNSVEKTTITLQKPESKYNSNIKSDITSKSYESLIIYTMKYDLIDIESEEKIQFNVDIPFDGSQDSNIKAFGSMSTYTQRYVFGEIFHLGFDEANPDATHNNKPQTTKADAQTPKAYNKSQSTKTNTTPPANEAPFPTDAPPIQNEPAPVNEQKEEPTRNKSITEPQRKRLFEIAAKNDITNPELKKFMIGCFGKDSSKDLAIDEYDMLCNLIESGEFKNKYSLFVK